jgi:protein-arginine kinase activator protein McsA
MGMPEKCESCGENEAKIRLVAFDKDDKVLDSMHICVDCTQDNVSELLPGCEDARE